MEFIEVVSAGDNSRAITELGEALAAALQAQCHLGIIELGDSGKGWQGLLHTGVCVGSTEAG
jgi:hypothetical protein